MKGIFWWSGKETNQYVLKNIKLNVALCPSCKKPTNVNLNYYKESNSYMGLDMPSKIKGVGMLCLGCGETYQLELDALLWSLKFLKEHGIEYDISNLEDFIEKTEKDITKAKKIEVKQKSKKP